jgi:H+/Cl- antiporter ClcA/CBS domain-containing protein
MKPDTAGKLGDYSADTRILYISVLAAVLGAASAVAAWVLVHLIWLGSNLFYRHQIRSVQLDQWTVGRHWWVPFMPVLGGLLVGLIARYLSPNVRGHGMPEAVETIVFKGGRVQPRVAVLKPVATAISIGSGGPFGAEGPVIMTGGAIGSVLGQVLSMSESERTVLMVAGAAAGMAATFNCPMAATLLAVEILLFEWKPRSLVPVAIACVTATAVRRLLLGPSPILNMAPTEQPVYHSAMLGALAVGILAAFLATMLGRAVHLWERMFEKLPIHWMWWPAIGGLGVGLCGLVFPEGLGVGFSNIQQMISSRGDVDLLLGILFVKTLMWSFSLGSNTAGGILAPLLMIGGALGASFGHVLPLGLPQGAWALVGMTAVLSAAIGAPLTAAMLGLEATHNGGLMLPVMLACVSSYAVSALVQRRSLLTAGLSRRGLHLSRELGTDPLETMLVAQAMHTSVFALRNDAKRQEAADWLKKMEERGAEAWSHWQRVFPMVDAKGCLTGMLTRSQMMVAARQADLTQPLANDANLKPAMISPENTLRACAGQMAESGLTSFPVVDSDGKFVGVITINDLLKGRTRQTRREFDRERVLRLRWPFGNRNQDMGDDVEAGMVSTDPMDVPHAAEAAEEEDHPTLAGHS